MLVKASELIKKRIVSFKSGSCLGFVTDLGFNLRHKKVTGLFYNNEANSNNEGFIKIDEVFNLYNENVLIEDISSAETEDRLSKRYCKEKGKRVISLEGKNLGILEDIVFEPKSGKINNLEISDGILSDLINGRKKLSLENTVILGKDFVIFQSEEGEYENMSPLRW